MHTPAQGHAPPLPRPALPGKRRLRPRVKPEGCAQCEMKTQPLFKEQEEGPQRCCNMKLLLYVLYAMVLECGCLMFWVTKSPKWK